MNQLFDIVIPVGPNDINQLNEQIKYHCRKSIQKLKWTNVSKLITDSDYDYVSNHWYMRHRI